MGTWSSSEVTRHHQRESLGDIDTKNNVLGKVEPHLPRARTLLTLPVVFKTTGEPTQKIKNLKKPFF